MPINLADYPRLIALPYHQTLSDNVQRKEYQRFCLELLLSFNAIVCLADYYRLKTSENKIDLKRLDLDLGQMSLGKWNAICRDVSKVLNESKASDLFLPQVYDLYHGKKKNSWNPLVDDLISRRNKDAHGSLVSDCDLQKELAERQSRLEEILSVASFYKDFKLVVPYDSKVIEGKAILLCKNFNGIDESIIDIEQSEDGLDLFKPYLYRQDRGTFLSLSPMLTCYPKDEDSGESRLFVYSKTLNKKKGNLHYYNYDGSWDFYPDKIKPLRGFPAQSSLCTSFSDFRIHVEREDLLNQKQPSLIVERCLINKTCSLGDDVVHILFSIKNDGDATAGEIKTVFDFPRQSFDLVDHEYQDLPKEPISLNLQSLDPGDSWSADYYFKPREAGQYEFDPLSIEYSYVDIQGNDVQCDPDQGVNVEECPSLFIEVFDPNDPDSLLPIINLNLSYDNDNPKIGERVSFNIMVKNIGRSVAKNVEICIFPPEDEVELLSGTTTWRGNLNPGQQMASQFVLVPKEHGIFSMKMRDIIFENQKGQLFKTLAYEDYKILVRNDPKVKYRYLMEDIWGDLVLDETELVQLEFFNNKYNLPSGDRENIQVETKIRIIKQLLEDVFLRLDVPASLVAGSNRIYYFVQSGPAFILDYSDYENLLVLCRAPLKEQCGIPVQDQWRRRYQKLSFTQFTLNDASANGGTGFLKKVANQTVSWLRKNDLLLTGLTNAIALQFGVELSQVRTTLDDRVVLFDIEERGHERFIANKLSVYTDNKRQTHLVMRYDAGTIGASLRDDLGYSTEKQDFLKYEADAIEPYMPSSKVSTQLRLNSLKINENNRRELLNPLPDFTRKTIELYANVLVSQMGLSDETQRLYDKLHELLKDELVDYTLSVKDAEAKSGTPCRGINLFHVFNGMEVPLFCKTKLVMRIRIDSKRSLIFTDFRIVDNEFLNEKISQISVCDKGVVDNNRWPYHVELNDNNLSVISSMVNFASHKSGESVHELSRGVLADIIEVPWAKNLKPLLQILGNYDNLRAKITEVDSEMIAQGIDSKACGYIVRGLNRSLNGVDFEHLFEYGKVTLDGEGVIAVKDKYIEMVMEILKNT